MSAAALCSQAVWSFKNPDHAQRLHGPQPSNTPVRVTMRYADPTKGGEGLRTSLPSARG